MSERTSSASYTAVFVSLPLLGLLFFSVPWERDARLDSREKRLDRLRNSRRFYLVDVMANVQEFNDAKQNNTRNGLFSWQEAELRKLEEAEQAAAKSASPSAIAQETIKDIARPETAIYQLLKNGRSLNIVLPNGLTPLTYIIHKALPSYAFDGETARVERSMELKPLIAATGPPNPKADPNLADARGVTPLTAVIAECQTGPGIERFKVCASNHLVDVCGNEKASIHRAETEDVFLIQFLEALIANGARVNTMVPKQIVHLEPGDEPRDITLTEYARRNCPAFIVKALTGNKEAPAHSPDARKP